MGSRNISKEELYQGVKTLIDSSASHIHLYQHKLFTLFSLGFQYLLFKSTKEAGHYIIRIEDGPLAEKLSYKAKDDTTRKFIQNLLIPRKLKFGKSTFYLDYFHIGSWSLTQELPHDMVKGALIVKNTVRSPLKEHSHPWDEITDSTPDEVKEEAEQMKKAGFAKDYYYSSLQEFVPNTIAIGLDDSYMGATKVTIPFIKEQEDSVLNGVVLAKDLRLEDV